jgi:exosortase A-associated hydrolase 1
MNYSEQALRFACQGEPMYGVLSLPEQPAARAILVVVGGPQYRAGSHRQFTLLARAWAAQGIAVLRFDYRGMGDSGGPMRTFESVGEDLRAAIDQLYASVPGLADVVVWGLCDAASAAMFYGCHDERVAGMVLLNPWARTSGTIAKTTLKHYYRARLMDPALWKKIASGQFNFRAAAASFAGQLRAVFGANTPRPPAVAPGPAGAPAAPPLPDPATLPQRMLDGLSRFEGRLLFIISEPDMTAREFMDMTQASRKWQRLLAGPKVSQRRLPDADHTFSRRVWRDEVAAWTAEWVRSW